MLRGVFSACSKLPGNVPRRASALSKPFPFLHHVVVPLTDRVGVRVSVDVGVGVRVGVSVGVGKQCHIL